MTADENPHVDYRAKWEVGWRRGKADAITWAFILIWAGLVFLAENLNWVTELKWWNTWAVILGGAGLILLVGGLTRLLSKDPQWRTGGSFILGLIFIAICLGMIGSWSIIWPLALIAVGLIIVVQTVVRHN